MHRPRTVLIKNQKLHVVGQSDLVYWVYRSSRLHSCPAS